MGCRRPLGDRTDRARPLPGERTSPIHRARPPPVAAAAPFPPVASTLSSSTLLNRSRGIVHVSKDGWNFGHKPLASPLITSASLSNQTRRNCPSYVALSRFTKLCSLKIFRIRAAWARDEPPSPADQHDFLPAPSNESLRRPSDVASYQSSDPGPSRWWPFTLPRPQRTTTLERDTLSEVKHDLRGNLLKDRPHSKRTGSGDTATVRNAECKENVPNGWGLHADLPRSPSRPFTLPHTQTPGWDTPWSARLPTSITRPNGNGNAYNQSETEEHQSKEEDKQTPWQQRKKMLRGFLLTNSYVPLVSVHVSIFHVNKT